jgi:PHD/YefM family antitoxin component YafN of YafNO toxin-antitoxin module
MSTIAAAELKRRGVLALEPVLAAEGEAVITVRGKSRYVVMTMAAYAARREAELDRAVREARADYAAGRVVDRSIKAHLRRVDHAV